MPRSAFRTAAATALGTVVAALTIASGEFVVTAQQQPPQQQRPPVFRGESVLVTVDVYPQRDGKVVEGLKTSDFEVLEDGKPQTVETLEFVRVEPGTPESARRDPNNLREMLELAGDPHNRVFVVFLDQLHVTIDGSYATRRPMVDALNRIIGPEDLFGVMTQNTDPRALTLGRRLLSVEEQLSKYWTWGERYSITGDRTDPMEDELKRCFEFKPPTQQQPVQKWFVDDNGQARLLYELLIDRRREDRTLSSMERLIERLAGMREARTVVLLVTEGWRLFTIDQGLANQAGVFGPRIPQVGSVGGQLTTAGPPSGSNRSYSQERDCNNELVRLSGLENESRFREIFKRANRANVSFYPINPAGLRVFDTPLSVENRPNLVEDGRRLTLRKDALLTLAENTDGLAVVDTNDLAAGMRKIVDDVSAYYLLGYYSTNPSHDGRFRRIEVKAKPAGLKVRARRGYTAPDNKPARETFTPAPAGPEPPKGLDTALGELGRLRPSADVFTRGAIVGDRAEVVVEIASARAFATPWSGGADVQVIVAPDGGAPRPPVTAHIDANTRGIMLTVPLGAAAASARVVTRVSAGGESLDDTAEISRGTTGLTGDAVMYRGRPAATSPLRPVADLQYRRTERVHAEWAFMGELDQRSARLLSRTGQPLAIPVAVTERETDGRKVVAADLNLAPLSAGEYVIELTVGRGTETVVRLVAFRVVQ
jgi:VWFA-related protein